MIDAVTAKKTRETKKQKTGIRKRADHALVKPDNQPLAEPTAVARFEEATASARDYANRNRSDATWRAYENDWKQFCDWCESVERPALPADSETVAGFRIPITNEI